MLIFQIYEFLAIEARWIKKLLAPPQYQAVIFDLNVIYKYKDWALADSVLQIGKLIMPQVTLLLSLFQRHNSWASLPGL